MERLQTPTSASGLPRHGSDPAHRRLSPAIGDARARCVDRQVPASIRLDSPDTAVAPALLAARCESL
jgi:hypothetical protein